MRCAFCDALVMLEGSVAGLEITHASIRGRLVSARVKLEHLSTELGVVDAIAEDLHERACYLDLIDHSPNERIAS